MNILCKNIQWDTSGGDDDGPVPELPKDVLVTNVPGEYVGNNEEAISDLLTERFAFCHKGFEMESDPMPVIEFEWN